MSSVVMDWIDRASRVAGGTGRTARLRRSPLAHPRWPGPMVKRARVAVLLATLAFVGACGDTATPANTDAVRAARAFLDRYVEPDGRVVRHDQGGDTVAEGQSYGLVLTQVVGDQQSFDRIWAWTNDHLRRRDGLLSNRWANGAVVDESSASDADLLTAWALLRAGGAYRDEGQRLAAAILKEEVVRLPAGLVLAAGQWATGEPSSLNPSYWALGVMRDMAGRTGDLRWSALADTAVKTVRDLTDDGMTLPPDWARVDHGYVSATPAPGGQAPDERYSLDSQRVVVWFATSSDATPSAGKAPRALAARWWTLLRNPGRSAVIALSPNGTVRDADEQPLPLVASAAAAAAAGDTAARDRLLARAGMLDTTRPSYYGSAWVALGQALLTTDMLAINSAVPTR